MGHDGRERERRNVDPTHGDVMTDTCEAMFVETTVKSLIQDAP